MNRTRIRQLPLPLRAAIEIVRPLGEHRKPRMPGQLTTQRFVWCNACGVETAATVHGALIRCTEGHFVHGGDR